MKIPGITVKIVATFLVGLTLAGCAATPAGLVLAGGIVGYVSSVNNLGTEILKIKDEKKCQD